MTPTEVALQLVGALAEPFTDPGSRTWWPFLGGAAVVAVGVTAWTRRSLRVVREALGVAHWRTRSARLDVELLAVRQLLGLLGVIPRVGSAAAIGVAVARTLDATVGRPELGEPGLLVHAGYTLGLFVAWDASRWVLHYALHNVPALWQLHQVHHSAEVLTPLTFHRVHPLEAVLYELRGVLVTGVAAGLAWWAWRGGALAASVLGVDVIGFVLSGLTGNLRHSHVWLRFGPTVERWLLSPAQHQLHHDADGAPCNYGVWLALWDRLAGSLRVAGATPPERFGLAEANHEQALGSALVGPLRAVSRSLRGRVGVALALAALALFAPAALAEEPATGAEAPDAEAPTGRPGSDEIVVSEGNVPVVGGAAHEVGAETLERYEHDDIQRVLARVPGVYVRGEDGVGLRPNIGMRGANSDRSAKITLLEDGIPLSPAPYAAPAAYYFPLTTRMVGVEVFKGPSAIAYGPQTIGGAVNLLTRPVPDATDGELDAAVGAFSMVKVHGWGGTSGKVGGVMVEGAHLSSGGFKELDGGGPTGFERQDVLAKGEIERGPHTFEAKLGFGRERSDETYLGLSLADFAATPYRRYAASQNDRMTWTHTQESLAWDVTTGKLRVRTVAYHNWLDRSWTKLNRFAGGPDLHDLLLADDAGQAATYAAILRGEEDSVTADQTLLVGTNARTFHNGGLQSVARLWTGGKGVSNLAELGVRVHADHARRVHTEDPFRMASGALLATGGEVATTLDSETSALAFSGWLRDQLRLGPALLVPGVRVEHIRTTSLDLLADTEQEEDARTIVLPGLAASVEATPWLIAFAGVHRGFSPLAPGSDPALEPETAWNAEAGVRLFPGSTYAEVAGYGSAYQDLSGQCTLSAGCSDADVDRQFSGGEALVAGVEALASHEILLPRALALRGNLTYTYTWSAFQGDFVSPFPQWGTVSAGDALPYVPVHQGAFEVLLEGKPGSVGVSGTWRGAMRDMAGQGPIPVEEQIPASFVLDLAADVRVTPQVSAYLVLRNATDTVTIESYRPFGARPGAPRTLLAGVKVAPRRAR